MEIVYTGPYEHVTTKKGQRFERGKPRKVDAALGRNLIQQEHFSERAAEKTPTTKDKE